MLVSILAAAVMAAGAAMGAGATVSAAEAGPPSIPVPARPLLFTQGQPPPMARIAGLDIACERIPLQGAPLTYLEGNILDLRLHWLPAVSHPTGRRLTVRLLGSGPALEETYEINSAAWEPGVVSWQTVAFRHVGGRYSGRATLTFTLVEDDIPADTDQAVLFACPVFVEPRRYPSHADGERIQAVFGAGAVRLNAAFRLGAGSAVELAVPDTVKGRFRGLGLVSAVGYAGELAAGEPVAEVRVLGEGGEARTTLRGQVHTARVEDDGDGRGWFRRRGTVVFSTRGEAGARPAYDHAGRTALEMPLRPGRIEIRYLKDEGVLDVREVVLLPEAP